ncbi:MAG: hypothetical protein KAX13_12055, partial [Candidatus Krumholzibacteria bacterium]|nr:hypothetical protein [Candidatus Krumholzibacteria bacterium]
MNRTQRAAKILLVFSCILLECSVITRAADRDFRIIATSERSITFEIEIPRAEIVPAGDGLVRVLLDGYGSFSPPGAPGIPGRSFRVALPPEGGYQIASSVLEWESLGRIRLARVFGERLVKGEDGIPITERFMPEDPWRRDGYRPDIVGTGTASFMGRQRVLPVRINPLVIEGEGVNLARRIRITVSFTGTAGIPPRAGVKPPAAGAWDRLYRDLLVNPADVERFRKPLDEVAVQRSTMQTGRRLKLTIPETGLFAVRADSLIDAGLSAGLSTGMIALKKYYYDESEPG